MSHANDRLIDVYAKAGTFATKHDLAQQLAAAVMRWEQVPPIALFENNTAAFVHDLEAGALSNVAGDGSYVRVQVLTPAGVPDRDHRVTRRRLGIGGHAYTGAEIAQAARRELGRAT